ISRDPLISWVPGSTWKWIVSWRILPAGMLPIRTGTVVPPSLSFTEPCHSCLVLLAMGRMILTLLAPSWPTRMSRRRPPHRPLACSRVMTAELEIVGWPCSGSSTVNGTFVACWHVSTCVRPCSDESRMGMRKAPSRAMSAIRERRTDGSTHSYRTLNGHERWRFRDGRGGGDGRAPERLELQPGPHPHAGRRAGAARADGRGQLRAPGGDGRGRRHPVLHPHLRRLRVLGLEGRAHRRRPGDGRLHRSAPARHRRHRGRPFHQPHLLTVRRLLRLRRHWRPAPPAASELPPQGR